VTDLSVTHPLTYVAVTTACWAVPTVALVWGVMRLRAWRNRPCGARYGVTSPTRALFKCALCSGHRGAHYAPPAVPGDYSFEWYDEQRPPPEGRISPPGA
jgi:hypothetical protein